MVENDGSIETDGPNSHGIYAQSVGGGGGAGGISVAAALSSSNGAASSVGGGGSAGGTGGDGGAAAFSGALNISGGDLNNTVGGAGAGGAGGNVTVISTGSITTLSPHSVGVSAQSIGGGGGSGTFSISSQLGSLGGSFLKIGGSGSGTQGANGKVIVKVSGGTTTTMGDLSYGVLSQAIGGGGGNGALSVPDPLTIGAGGSSQTVGASGAISGNGNPLNTESANAIADDWRRIDRLRRTIDRWRRRHVGRQRGRDVHGAGTAIGHGGRKQQRRRVWWPRGRRQHRRLD